MIVIIFDVVISSPLTISFLVRCVIDQNRNRIHEALIKALIMLTIFATCDGSLANREKKLPVSIKKGAPGG